MKTPLKCIAPFITLLFAAAGHGCTTEGSPSGGGDWPQYRGPNRDGVVLNSPKLLDSWPKEGPPLVWTSEFIPSYACGGVGNPVVADGKVFLYSNRKEPLDGGQKYKFVTTQSLIDMGWNPDLPDALAKKIEEARVAPARPPTDRSAPPWNAVDKPTEAQLDAFLAKNPELDKYLKDFIATLEPSDVKKFGAYIKRRFCMCTKDNYESAYSWDKLVKLSTLRDWECESDFEMRVKLGQTFGVDENLNCVRIYRATTLHDTVYCLDAKTGKTIWKKDFPVDEAIVKAVRHLGDWGTFIGYLGALGVSSTPAIWKEKCYVAGANGLYCFSIKDGALLWQAKSNVNGLPSHASPLVAGGIAYHQGSAYNAEDGKLIWSQTQDGWGVNFESPPLWSSGGKNYVIAFCGCSKQRGWVNKWGCLDMETGKILWHLEGVRGECIYNPTVNGDTLWTYSAEPNVVRKYKLSTAGAELLWTYGDRKNPIAGNWVPWQNHLYILAGADRYSPAHVDCLNLETGASKWKSATYTDCGVSIVPPVVADGKMFNSICRGNDHATRSAWRPEDAASGVYGYALEMVRASPEGGYVRLGKFSPGICNFSSPALAGGMLYLRLDKCVACYDLRAK